MEFAIILTYPPGTKRCADRILFSARYNEDELRSFGISNDNIDFNDLYKGNDEFNKIRKLWQDPAYLNDFYNENEHFFNTEYWNNISKTQFITDTIASAPLIFDKLKKATEENTLEELFQPLDKEDGEKADYTSIRVKSKYGEIRHRFAFRIYAVKIEDGCYVITGGAIKIAKDMGKAPNTRIELAKINQVYAEIGGMDDKNSFIEFVFE